MKKLTEEKSSLYLILSPKSLFCYCCYDYIVFKYKNGQDLIHKRSHNHVHYVTQ